MDSFFSNLTEGFRFGSPVYSAVPHIPTIQRMQIFSLLTTTFESKDLYASPSSRVLAKTSETSICLTTRMFLSRPVTVCPLPYPALHRRCM